MTWHIGKLDHLVEDAFVQFKGTTHHRVASSRVLFDAAAYAYELFEYANTSSEQYFSRTNVEEDDCAVPSLVETLLTWNNAKSPTSFRFFLVTVHSLRIYQTNYYLLKKNSINSYRRKENLKETATEMSM